VLGEKPAVLRDDARHAFAAAREAREVARGPERRDAAGRVPFVQRDQPLLEPALGRGERMRRFVGAGARDAASQLEEAIRRMPKSTPSEPAARSPGLAPAPSPASAAEPGSVAVQGLARGRTSRPVAGRTRAGFGRQVDPEFQTQTLRTGIEIAAPAGSSVLAVSPGRVLFAGWFRGYGQMVIVDHGAGDLSVSGYLDEALVAAGDSVALGQPIGSVGETGSASGPGLYFEIRHDGKAVDPALWLEK